MYPKNLDARRLSNNDLSSVVQYVHIALSSVTVVVGDYVSCGDYIARSGGVGFCPKPQHPVRRTRGRRHGGERIDARAVPRNPLWEQPEPTGEQVVPGDARVVDVDSDSSEPEQFVQQDGQFETVRPRLRWAVLRD